MKLNKLSTLTLLLSSLLMAEGIDDNNTSLNLDFEREAVWTFLPYAFSSDSTGLAGGVAVIAQGLLQPDTTFVATLTLGAEEDIITNGKPDTESFGGGLIAFDNFKIPYTDRLFFTTFGYMTTIPKQSLYLDSSHGSSEDDVLITSGESNFFTAMF